MKKIKVLGVLAMVFSLAFGTVVMAAPSPSSSVIWVLPVIDKIVNPGSSSAVEAKEASSTNTSSSSSSSVSNVSSEEVKASGAPVATETAGPAAVAVLANAITLDAAKMGGTPVVKAVKNVIPPAGYVPGTPVTITWAVAGVKDGTVLYAYSINADGSTSVSLAVVKGGYATFTLTSLRAVALVEFVNTPTTTVAGLH